MSDARDLAWFLRDLMQGRVYRDTATLAAMTGNIGNQGGHVAGGAGRMELGALATAFDVPEKRNPKIHMNEIWDALLTGKSGGYPADIKLVYIVGCNLLNQFLNTNKGVSALNVPEFIVIQYLLLPKSESPAGSDLRNGPSVS